MYSVEWTAVGVPHGPAVDKLPLTFLAMVMPTQAYMCRSNRGPLGSCVIDGHGTSEIYPEPGSPLYLYLAATPAYTLQKARELYGGEPRPLSARHEFVRQVFLSDTEDWRSNACIGNSRAALAQMNIVQPRQSRYLEQSTRKPMSYYRQKSLTRALSYRSVLYKKNGELADSQYSDSYVGREHAVRALRGGCAADRSHAPEDKCESLLTDAPIARELSRTLSCSRSLSHGRDLVKSFSRLSRLPSASGSSASAAAASPMAGAVAEDMGASRAIGHIMTRSRSRKVSSAVSAGLAKVGEDSMAGRRSSNKSCADSSLLPSDDF